MIELAHGDYAARIDPEGAALISITHRGRELTLHVEASVPTPPYSGLVLAPWPNRIADGRYDFAGQTHQLPINEIDRGTALHGLVLWERWDVTEVTDDRVVLACEPVPRPGYPFRLRLTATYAVREQGVGVELEATNLDSCAAPVGLATHPYFVNGTAGTLDQWSLRLPCSQVIEVDDRLIPVAERPAGELGLDFTTGRRLGDTVLDHAFSGVVFDAAGAASCDLLDEDGGGIRLEWDDRCRWVQAYTMHAPDQPWHRRAVAIEPMTCAPDAFNSGAGLQVLEPGETTSMGWRAGVVDAPA